MSVKPVCQPKQEQVGLSETVVVDGFRRERVPKRILVRKPPLSLTVFNPDHFKFGTLRGVEVERHKVG